MTTRRSEDAGSHSDRKAWRFETGGLGEFGQLVPESTGQHGTEVRLRLRPDVIGASPDEWFEKLVRYVQNNVTRVPCHFILRHHNIEKPAIDIPAPGWVRIPQDFSERLLGEFKIELWRSSSDSLRPAAEVQKQDETEAKWRELAEIAKKQLRFYGPIEGALPNGTGRFRIFLPYFEYPAGASLAFMNLKRNKGEKLPGNVRTLAVRCSSVGIHSWRGFLTNLDVEMQTHQLAFEGSNSMFVTEVDWMQGGKVSVTRDALRITKKDFFKARENFLIAARNLLQSFMREHRNSRYVVLNKGIAVGEYPFDDFEMGERVCSISAPLARPLASFTWEKVAWPAVELVRSSFSVAEAVKEVIYKGKKINIYGPIGIHGHYSSIYPLREFPGKRLLLIRDISGIIPATMWLDPAREKSGAIGISRSATDFPSAWKDLAAISTTNGTMWNSDNQLVQAVDEDSWRWVVSNVEDADPRPHKDAILGDRSRCAAWLLFCLNLRKGKRFWQGLCDLEPNFLNQVWTILFGVDSDPISCVVRTWVFGRRFRYSTETIEMTPNSIKTNDWTLNRDRANAIQFTSGFTLEIPDNSDWVADVVFDQDKLPERWAVIDGLKTKGRKGKRAKKGRSLCV